MEKRSDARPVEDHAENEERGENEEDFALAEAAQRDGARQEREPRRDAERAGEAADRLRGRRRAPRLVVRQMAEEVRLEKHDHRREVGPRHLGVQFRIGLQFLIPPRLRHRLGERSEKGRGDDGGDGDGRGQRGERSPWSAGVSPAPIGRLARSRFVAGRDARRVRAGRPHSDEDLPQREEPAEERDVRDGLRMSAEEHHRPHHHRENESPVRTALDQQVHRQQRRRQPHADRDQRKVQPGVVEGAERKGDGADGAGQLRVSPPTEQVHECQRDQQLHRRLGCHGVAERQRQREQADRRQRRALSVRQERIAGAGEMVPEREMQRAPGVAHLRRPRHDLHRQIVHHRIRQMARRAVVPRRKNADEVDRNVDRGLRHRPEEEDQDERVEEARDAPLKIDAPAPGQPDGERVERGHENPRRVKHGRG